MSEGVDFLHTLSLLYNTTHYKSTPFWYCLLQYVYGMRKGILWVN